MVFSKNDQQVAKQSTRKHQTDQKRTKKDQKRTKKGPKRIKKRINMVREGNLNGSDCLHDHQSWSQRRQDLK